MRDRWRPYALDLWFIRFFAVTEVEVEAVSAAGLFFAALHLTSSASYPH